METGSSTLVEATPNEYVWGNGLSCSNHKATDRKSWKGANWMGIILTQVREELKLEAEA